MPMLWKLRLFWYRADKREIAELEPTGTVLGMRVDVKYRSTQIEVGRGDVLLFYTDGFTEAFNEQQDLFGEDRMKEILSRHAAEPPSRLLEAILGELEAFVGKAEQSDDITLLCVRWNGPEAASGR